MTVHHVLSPSGADRWSNCLGALAACKDIKEQRTNEAAAKGTAKHAVSEWILRNPTTHMTALQTEKLAQADGFKFEVDVEFAEHVNAYVRYVRSRPGVKRYEVKLDTSYVMGVAGQGGTADCIHLDYSAGEIEVIDAKFGYIPVGADHKQLRWYGSAALALYDLEHDWKTVRCTIVQPQDRVESIKSQVFTRAEIEEFVRVEAPKAQKAHALWLNPPADLLKYLTPSDAACAWCPISGDCEARQQRFTNMFQDVTKKTPDVVLMSNEQIGDLISGGKLEDMVEWAKAVMAAANARALLGQTIPGQKLIYGRKGNREYAEGTEDIVKGVLEMALGEDQMYAPRKLVSPTQAQEALKAANAPALYATIEPYITRSDPKLKLVPLTTKGDAVTVKPVQFEVVI